MATTTTAAKGPAWVPAGRRHKAWETIPVVEPQYPRKAPKEIASGISFRGPDLPGARCVELVKVCDFYEAKASGGYVDSAMCGRYLHAMAREVRALAAALRESEKRRRLRVRELETVCEEWEAHFGSATQGELGIVPMTPAAVAAQGKCLREQLAAARAEAAVASAASADARAASHRELEQYQAAARSHAERVRAHHAAETEARALDADRRLADAASDAAARRDDDLRARERRRWDERRAFAETLGAARDETAALKTRVADLERQLKATRDDLDAKNAALRAAAAEVANARALRRDAVEEALRAQAAVRRATQTDQASQCPAARGDTITFKFRTPSKPKSRSIVALGVPPTMAASDLCAAIASRLGVDILSAAPRRALAVDGARHFDLLAATPEDATRLVEARALPDAAPDVLVIPRFLREPPTSTPQPASLPDFPL